MAAKTNNKTSPKSLKDPIGPILGYKPSSLAWDLEASYEDYRLIFSADFSYTRVWRERYQSVLNFFRGQHSGNFAGSVDIYQLFSKSAKNGWNSSLGLARKRGVREVCVEDIFLALLKEPSVKKLLTRLKVSGRQAENFIFNYLKLTQSLGGETVKKIPFEAFVLAVKLHNHKVGALMLLGGLLKATPHDNILQAIFTNIGLTAAKLELFSVWLLDLHYEFPSDSTSEKLLFCLNQASALERHFGYFFELPAIEAAVELSQGQTLKDLQHLKALQLLVKAGLLAKTRSTKIISQSLVEMAARR